MNDLLTVRGLTAGYGSVPILRGLDLDVREGEIVLLLGPNGAGKTTTLRAISGLGSNVAGSIVFGTQEIRGRRAHDIVRLGIAHVPEGRRIFPTHTVEENLELGGYRWLGRREYGETLERVFELFPVLRERRVQLAGTLSGGEAQMLAIGRALMTRPRLLMLDEPSLGLAPQVVRLVFSFIRQLRDEAGLSVLLVEQAAAAALRVAERGYVLGGGTVALAGTADELARDPRVKEVYLGA